MYLSSSFHLIGWASIQLADWKCKNSASLRDTVIIGFSYTRITRADVSSSTFFWWPFQFAYVVKGHVNGLFGWILFSFLLEAISLVNLSLCKHGKVILSLASLAGLSVTCMRTLMLILSARWGRCLIIGFNLEPYFQPFKPISDKIKHPYCQNFQPSRHGGRELTAQFPASFNFGLFTGLPNYTVFWPWSWLEIRNKMKQNIT